MIGDHTDVLCTAVYTCPGDAAAKRSHRAAGLGRAIVRSIFIHNRQITKYPALNNSLTKNTIQPGHVSRFKMSPMDTTFKKCIPLADSKTAWPVALWCVWNAHRPYLIQVQLAFHTWKLVETKENQSTQLLVEIWTTYSIPFEFCGVSCVASSCVIARLT